MFPFIFMLTICVLTLITSIITGFKTYQRKIKNNKIISINRNENRRKKDNFIMILSVISSILSTVGTIYTLLNSVPSPTIYPLNNEARVYDGTADVIIESYPIFSIYYSLDGSDPKDGNIYTDRFKITETTTVVAKNRFLHFFWSEPSKSTYRFESTQNITVNSVDNNIDDRIEAFLAYLFCFLLILAIFVPVIRGR